MINVGIIGTGVMADIYASIIKKRVDADLCYIVGNTEKKTKDFCLKFNINNFAINSNIKKMYQESNVDTTIIATPEWSREHELKTAIGNDQNILIEKPFTTDLEMGKNFLKLLSKHNKVIDICTVLRHSPKFCAAIDKINEGAIGEIRHIFAKRDSNNSRVKRVIGKTKLAYWLAPHDLDIIYAITKSRIKNVNVLTRNKCLDADDYLIASIKLENNVSAVLQNSWCTIPTSNLTKNALFEIYGTLGKIEIDDSEMDVRLFSNLETSQPDTYEFSNVNGVNYGLFYNLIDNFLRRIHKNDNDNDKIIDAIEINMEMCELLNSKINQ